MSPGRRRDTIFAHPAGPGEASNRCGEPPRSSGSVKSQQCIRSNPAAAARSASLADSRRPSVPTAQAGWKLFAIATGEEVCA